MFISIDKVCLKILPSPKQKGIISIFSGGLEEDSLEELPLEHLRNLESLKVLISIHLLSQNMHFYGSMEGKRFGLIVKLIT